MTEIFLVRHGHPLSGQADPPLSPAGRDQAARVGRWLADEGIDVVVTSPMTRALQTAELATRELGLSITSVMDDLREWDLDHAADGNYVALEELGDANPRFRALRTGHYEDFIPAIDRVEFLERSARALDAVINSWRDQRVAVFTHGGFINGALSTVLGLESKLFFFLPDYASVSIVREMPGGRRVVHALNRSSQIRESVDVAP